MMLYTLAINSVFRFPDSRCFLVLARHGDSRSCCLTCCFYIIITPVITLTMTSLMYMSENNMIVADAIERVDRVLKLSRA